MLNLIRNRLLMAIPMLAILSVVVFLMLQVMPVDPVLVRLGDYVTDEQYQKVYHELGLDKSLVSQYVTWLSNALKGDLGNSLINGQKVSSAIWSRMPVTFSLAILGGALALLIGIPAGTIAGLSPGKRIDRSLTTLSTLGLAMPNFWTSMLLASLFSVSLGWTRATGYVAFSDSYSGWFSSTILPSFALGFTAAASVARQMRGSIITVLQKEYVRTAISLGESRSRVIGYHVMRNALAPVLTVFGLQLINLIGGAIVVEQVFAMPGLGSLVVRSVLQSDITMIQGIVLVIALLVIVVNLTIDIIIGFLNPRIRSI